MDTHVIPGLILWLTATTAFGASPQLWGQTPVRPIDDGSPRYSVDSVETQFATLWRQRARHPYVCVVGQVPFDSRAGAYVQVDSLRIADEPWATCNDAAVMGMIKLVDEIPVGTTLEEWGETMAQQLVAVALRQSNWRIIGVMFAIVTATMPDATAADTPGSDALQQSLVPGFLWWARTAENVRVLDELSGRADWWQPQPLTPD